MGITERGLLKKEQIRDSILEAARAMVLKDGWQSVSIRKIADAIGYSLPVVYNHFENKDAILEEFVKQGFSMLGGQLAIVKFQSSDPISQMKDMANAYFKFAFSHREFYQMMFGLGMPSCETARQIPEIGNFGSIIITTIQQLSNEPTANNKVMLKYHTFWSILHGLSSINMVNITATPDAMQQLVLQDAVQGFIKNINN